MKNALKITFNLGIYFAKNVYNILEWADQGLTPESFSSQ